MKPQVIFNKLTVPVGMSTDQLGQIVNRVQDNVAAAHRPLQHCPLLDGALLQTQTLKAGQDNSINHGLGRKPYGYIVTRCNGVLANICDVQDSNKTPALTLTLRASADVVIDIWIF